MFIGFLRGENLKGKRRFIDWDGIEFLVSILQDPQKYSSVRLQSKIFFLLQDFIYYDDKLQFEDMITYTKVSGEMPVMTYDDKGKPTTHIGLKEDKPKGEEEKKETTEKVDVKSDEKSDKKEEQPLSYYKDIVKKKLIEKGFVDTICSYLTTEDLKNRLTLRSAAVSILEILVRFGNLKLDEVI